jgi:hypothetical protein
MSQQLTVRSKILPRRANRSRSKPVPKPRRKNVQLQPGNRRTARAARPDPTAMAWVRSLNDPFRHGPVRLGFGTMVPTMLMSSTFRNTYTANADGSFAIFVNPAVGSTNAPIVYNTSGLAGTTWGSNTWPNVASVLSQVAEIRTVSLGIKVFPLVASTVAPPIVYSGCIPSGAPVTLIARSPTDIANLPYMSLNVGPGQSTGYVALSRPTDLSAFDFTIAGLTGVNTVAQSWCIPAVVITGLPTLASVSVEVVYNFEGIQSGLSTLSSTSGALNEDQSNQTGFFPTMESMWRFAAAHLSPQNYPGASATIMENVSNVAIATGGRLMRNYIRNLNQRRYPPGRVLIEEMN